jgi:hypothetical protein
MAIRIARGTRASFNALVTANSLISGRLYLITDESRICVGLSSNTYSDHAKLSEVGGTATGMVYQTFTRVTITNTATQTTVLTAPIPAGELAAANCLMFDIDGTLTNGTAGAARTYTFELSLDGTGGAVLWSKTTGSIATSAARHRWRLTGKLFLLGGSSTAPEVGANLDMGTAVATGTGDGDIATVPAATTGASGVLGNADGITTDMSAARNLVLKITANGTASTASVVTLDGAVLFHPGKGGTGATGAPGASGAGTGQLPPATVQTASFSATSAQVDHETSCAHATVPIVVTLPLSAFSADGQMMAFRAGDAAAVSFVAGSGVTIKSVSANGTNGALPAMRQKFSPSSARLDTLANGIVYVDGDIV